MDDSLQKKKYWRDGGQHAFSTQLCNVYVKFQMKFFVDFAFIHFLSDCFLYSHVLCH